MGGGQLMQFIRHNHGQVAIGVALLPTSATFKPAADLGRVQQQ
jgi:hypothetical protein